MADVVNPIAEKISYMNNVKKAIEDRYAVKLDYDHYKQKVDKLRMSSGNDPVKLMRVNF